MVSKWITWTPSVNCHSIKVPILDNVNSLKMKHYLRREHALGFQLVDVWTVIRSCKPIVKVEVNSCSVVWRTSKLGLLSNWRETLDKLQLNAGITFVLNSVYFFVSYHEISDWLVVYKVLNNHLLATSYIGSFKSYFR